ncbi:MAG: IS66 family transposase, partial [Isosphaeraceae bacterium]
PGCRRLRRWRGKILCGEGFGPEPPADASPPPGHRPSFSFHEPELLQDLPDQDRLNVDETGHKQNGQAQWIWCFRAGLYTLFKIDPTRSGDVLIDVLGTEFDGVLGCDYFSAYRRYHREFGVVLQFFLAHLIRDVKFLTTLPDPQDRAYGERLIGGLRRLFGVIHRRAEFSAAEFQRRLEAARAEVLHLGTRDVPATNHCRNLAKRFEKHGESYFRFITTPGVEPTNNLAQQAIRFVVIDRLITQGTRSEKGNRWCERIWTVIATCTQQGRSVFEYLEAAVTAWFHGEEAPSLLPRVSSSQGQRAGWSIGGRKVREDREATGRMPPGASVARVRRRPAPRG